VGEGDGVVSVVLAALVFQSPLPLLYISVPAFSCLSSHIFNFMTCTLLGNQLGPYGTREFTGFSNNYIIYVLLNSST